jgi:hypothetical protein
MRTGDSFPRRRRRDPATEPDPTPDWSTQPATVADPLDHAFTCSRCRRDLPLSDRSRVALGRCRACV